MSAVWATKRLGDVCDIIGGGTPPKENAAFYGGSIPWATVRDMRSDVIEATEHSITRAALDGSSSKIIPAGNVVIATRVGLGKVCLLAKDTAINQDLRGVVPRTQDINVRFLYHWLRSVAPSIIKEGTGATVQGVKLPFVKSLQLPLPPLTEQERIVAILDAAFEGITSVEEATKKNSEFAAGLLFRELDIAVRNGAPKWICSELGEESKFIDYRGKTPTKTGAGVRLITAKNIRMGYVRDEPEEFIAPSDYDSWMTRGIPRRGDVLFTTEAPLGLVAQLVTDEKTAFAQRVIILQAKKNRLDGTFLKYALMSNVLQKRIHKQATGATALGIKASLLKKIQIDFPASLGEQRKLAKRFQELEEQAKMLEDVCSQKLRSIQLLRESLLHQAFSGNL